MQPKRLKSLRQSVRTSRSTTTSTLFSPSCSTSREVRESVFSAPSCRTSRALLSLVIAKTRAPRARANWMTAEPTPPDAPVTRMVSSLETFVLVRDARQAGELLQVRRYTEGRSPRVVCKLHCRIPCSDSLRSLRLIPRCRLCAGRIKQGNQSWIRQHSSSCVRKRALSR